MKNYKTKEFVEFMKAINVKEKSLFILSEVRKEVIKSASNIKKTKTSFIGEINVYDILNCEKLILELPAVEKIEEVYA